MPPASAPGASCTLAVELQADAALTLRAGTRVVLGDGVRVESGGSLVLEVF